MLKAFCSAFLTSAAVFVLTGVAIPQSAITPGRSASEKALVQMENEWGAAVSNRDSTALGKILADDWVGRYPYAVFSKAEEMEVIRSGDLRVDSVVSSDFKVRLFGDAAVVTGADDDKASYKGKDISGRYLWMDVFVKRSGQWRVVASQESLLMK